MKNKKKFQKKRFRLTPQAIVALSFLLVIVIGTLLLMLPFATTNGKGLSFVHALFMTVTSVCVTGLSVVGNIATEISLFGHIVMAILIEIGGLSFITIAIFLFSLFGAKIGLTSRYLVKEQLNQEHTNGVLSLVKKIILISFTIQGIGALITFLLLFFGEGLPFWSSVGISLFHSISSFNNAGLDCFGDASMIPYANHVGLNLVTVLLIFFGGIGFTVVDDLLRQRRWRKLSLHSKVALVTSLILVVVGTLGYLVSGSGMNFLQSLFLSVSSRTGGFASFPMAEISPSAYALTIFLMFVGASPCSTGGGIKTTTLFAVILGVYSVVTGKDAKSFHRKIAEEDLFKAFSIVVIMVLMEVLFIFVISRIENDQSFGIGEIVFEVVSAFSTTGLSMGITRELHAVSQVLLCLAMFFGRIGPLTIMSMFYRRKELGEKRQIQYVEERLMIG